jgi:hypothetical protein
MGWKPEIYVMVAARRRLTGAPLSTANATFALNTGVWFRRVRFVICAPDQQAHARLCQAENPLNTL